VKLCPTDLAAAHDLDGIDHRRVDREDPLDALTVGNLADGEILVEPGAGAADADAFIGLDTAALALNDLHVDAKRIAGLEFRDRALFGESGNLFAVELFDNVHRLNPFGDACRSSLR